MDGGSRPLLGLRSLLAGCGIWSGSAVVGWHLRLWRQRETAKTSWRWLRDVSPPMVVASVPDDFCGIST